MWGQISVVIVPSFLAITYLGQSIDLTWSLIKTDINLSSLATNLATLGAITFIQGNLDVVDWGVTVIITSFALSMAVNALVTGLIVFKILKGFLAAKALTTSVERTLGTSGGTQLRQVIFIIIESGMALLAIQLARVTLYFLQSNSNSASTINAYIMFIGINEMFNVIIRSVCFYFFFFTDNIYYLARASHQQ